MNVKLLKHPATLLLVTALNPAGVWADSISVSTPKPAVILDGAQLDKRVCYYEDKAYSEGAVLQVGEVYLLCQRANRIETNGPLKWGQLNQADNKR